MNQRAMLRQRVMFFAAPIALVAIGYSIVFQAPLQRELAQRLAKQYKLEDVASRRPASQTGEAERLSALRAEERALALELEESKTMGAKLVTQRADRRAELFDTQSPASLVSQALELLERHRLECLDSSPVQVASTSANMLQSLKPVADLLGGPKEAETCRREVRIKLAGRFEDMQAAVREMQAVLPDIFTVCLEMEAADGRTDRRIWILTISV